MSGHTQSPSALITNPSWVGTLVEPGRTYSKSDDRMRLVLDLARQNVLEETGGPFAAAVFEEESGRLVALGVNQVVACHNSSLHAEIVALSLAQQRVGSYTLGQTSGSLHHLVASCDPCAMCLGATLWSGVSRLSTGALGEDARTIGFDEGPVFPASFEYLEKRGVRCERGVLREEAKSVFEEYQKRGGVIYNR